LETALLVQKYLLIGPLDIDCDVTSAFAESEFKTEWAKSINTNGSIKLLIINRNKTTLQELKESL